MKLNKKVCRKSAELKWSMDLNYGLFCAEQIQYIVKLEVGDVDHQGIPILHIYDRKKVAAGGTRPLWTMSQSHKQHLAPACRDDGSTFWRSVAFDSLDRYYLFEDKCAFYSMNDEKRVMQLCKTDQKDDFSYLNSLQPRIMYQNVL